MKKVTDYTITKSTVQCYKFRHESGMYWADITIDTQPGSRQGRISIASDFGSWQNYWGACGPDFKTFLSKLDIHYTAGKFGADGWFDHDATIKKFKTDVLDYRRREQIESEEAREMWDSIKEMEDYNHKEEFVAQMYHQDALMSFYDNCPDLVTDITPQFKNFWDTIWPLLLEEFQKEVSEQPQLVQS
jgi:hypothetical protein